MYVYCAALQCFLLFHNFIINHENSTETTKVLLMKICQLAKKSLEFMPKTQENRTLIFAITINNINCTYRSVCVQKVGKFYEK